VLVHASFFFTRNLADAAVFLLLLSSSAANFAASSGSFSPSLVSADPFCVVSGLDDWFNFADEFLRFGGKTGPLVEVEEVAVLVAVLVELIVLAVVVLVANVDVESVVIFVVDGIVLGAFS
jgi:hypothetical protein